MIVMLKQQTAYKARDGQKERWEEKKKERKKIVFAWQLNGSRLGQVKKGLNMKDELDFDFCALTCFLLSLFMTSDLNQGSLEVSKMV